VKTSTNYKELSVGNYDHVFEPITLKGVEFKNRLQTAPQANMLSPIGLVTPELINFFRNYARGGFGTVTVGDTVIDTEYSPGHDLSLNLGNDDVITGLSEMAENVFRYGAQVSIEISHAGRNARRRLLGGKNPIAPSPIPNGMDEMIATRLGRIPLPIKEMDDDLIARVIENYSDAVYRCYFAGFNMVMIHAAHGQLIGQFVSPYSNKRIDRWGGSLENRARFPLALLDAIRKKCGNGLIIEWRISIDERVEGGMAPGESIEFLKIIEDKIDIVHASAGLLLNPDTVQHMIQPLYTPHMYNVHLAELVKKHINLPVTAVGSIMNLDEAESILARGQADFVALGRPALADPELPRKVAQGRPGDVRPCVRCNSCTRVTQFSKNHRCAINPMAGRDSEFNQHEGLAPARTKKKIMVVGGGVAGMQAAQTAVSRGHDVVLYEMSDHLGGTLEIAAELPFKTDLKTYAQWMIRKTKECGAKIVMNTEVTADTVRAEIPDALIIAVGATPFIPAVPGFDSDKVVWAGDVDSGKAGTGKNVIVVGAGMTGIETAINIASQGKTVTVIEMLGPEVVLAEASSAHKYYLVDRIKEFGIRVVTHTKMEEVTENGIRAINKDLKWINMEADTIVLAMGMKARKEKVGELRRLIPESEVFVVGDCNRPRSIFEANHEGFNAVCDL
jgi:2,4-dienoyl-CoA reductase-like NADH-dependent reductase (Old Yellow Enzyme family)/thioredoxin reductase